MQRVRDVLRGSLGRALHTLPDEDRLAAAWPVACGAVLAARAEVLGLDADGVLHVRVLEAGWWDQFAQMRSKLAEDLRQIAGVQIKAIHFEEQTMNANRTRNVQRPRVDAGPPKRRKSVERK